MSIFLKLLLYILLLILVLFVFALVCPVTYKVYFEKKGQPFSFSVRAAYLLGSVRFFYRYPGEDGMSLRLLGIPLLKSRKTNQETKKEEMSDNGNDEAGKTDTSNIKKFSQSNIMEKSVDSSEDIRKDKQGGQSKQQSERTKKKETKSSGLEHLKTEFSFYRKLLEAEFTREFLKDAFGRLMHILRSILPKKLKGWIRFGANTPDITGLAMAGYGMLFYNRRFLKNFSFETDFENQVLEGTVWVKGSACPAFLLWQALRIIFDKRLGKIRRVLKQHKLRNEKKENKNGR